MIESFETPLTFSMENLATICLEKFPVTLSKKITRYNTICFLYIIKFSDRSEDFFINFCTEIEGEKMYIEFLNQCDPLEKFKDFKEQEFKTTFNDLQRIS